MKNVAILMIPLNLISLIESGSNSKDFVKNALVYPFLTVAVFILCWAPYIVFDLLQVYGHIPRSKTMTAVATFIQSLAPLNSAANPLIYCLFSTHICRNLR